MSTPVSNNGLLKLCPSLLDPKRDPPKTRAFKRRRIALRNRSHSPQPLPRHGILTPASRHHSLSSSRRPNPPSSPTLIQNCPRFFPFFQFSPFQLSLRFFLQSRYRHSLQSSTIRCRLATHRPNGPKRRRTHLLRFLDFGQEIDCCWSYTSGHTGFPRYEMFCRKR